MLKQYTANMSNVSIIKQEPDPVIQRVPSPVQRKDRRCSLFRVITGVSVAALAVLASLGGVLPSNGGMVQTSPTLGNSNQLCKLGSYSTPTPFEVASPKFCAEEEDPALVERRQLESRYRKLPCPPQMQKIVAFTSVVGGRGDVAASAKAIDVMRTMCPLATFEWVLNCDFACQARRYDPRLFLNHDDPLKIHLRNWGSEPSDKAPVDFLLMGPVDPIWGLKYLESGLGRKITGPVFGFVENSETPRWWGKEPFLGMGLRPGTGVFLDRSRIEAPLSRGYCCPSYLPQIQDIGLRKDILEAMNVFDEQSQPDYDQYSFNSGYAHHDASWGKFIDSVAIHERDKHVVIVLNQQGAFSGYTTHGFQDELFTPDRLAFLRQKGYGTVILKGEGLEPILLQEAENPGLERRLTVIIRPSFVPSDMRRMQLASERLLATGDNSAVEAWSARCKLYLYEDVANLGSKWRFLQQQVDLAQTISPNLAKLLALFGGDRRLPQRSLNTPLDKKQMDELEQLLNDPNLGNATLKF